MKKDISVLIRENKVDTLRSRLALVARLSLPAMLSQLAWIVLDYIDASMVGSLGAEASAAIGLVGSSTWLVGNLFHAAASGFGVQAAQAIGAGNYARAKNILRQAIVTCFLFSFAIGAVTASISWFLPGWLGGDESIRNDSFMYFFIFAVASPVSQAFTLGNTMLQCSGSMGVSSIFSVTSCALDMLFNFFLIFPTRQLALFGAEITMPGAGLGVAGASLGTELAKMAAAIPMFIYLTRRSPILRLSEKGRWKPERSILRRAVSIGLPMGIEQTITCGAYVASTVIVSPLKNAALAAHSFAITTESFCYMPGFGLGSAATTLVGQSIGAGKPKLARNLGWLAIVLGSGFMAIAGVVIYFTCPYILSFLTPVQEVRDLGVMALRTELWAEALYGASIVAMGALRGAGDTLVPGIMNIASIWGVRITLSLIFVNSGMGLKGVWLAMAIELSVRGILMLIRYARGRWLKKV